VIASYTGESRVRAERHNGAGKELMLTNPGWSKSLCTTANLWSVVGADRTMFAGTFLLPSLPLPAQCAPVSCLARRQIFTPRVRLKPSRLVCGS
jgi:hypothetical protein